MGTLRPKRIGDIPVGLGDHHREFLRRMKDSVEILMGALQSQLDSSLTVPGSQAVTFGDITGDSTETNHAPQHENAGGDEISVTGLSGLLADEQDPLNHAGDHENTGGDEISVLDLSGLLADLQKPLDHTHQSAGSGVGGRLAASVIDPDTTNFGTILSAAEDTVQKALDALDDGGVPIVGKVNVVAGITKGQSVCVTGATGDKPQIELGDNTIHNCSHTLAVAMETKTNNQSIRVMRLGFITGVDTSSFGEGDRMHLGSAGAMQAAVVTSGAHIHMGWVTKSDATEGIMLIGVTDYVHDIRGVDDQQVEIACGDDDATGWIDFQNYSRNSLGKIYGTGLFDWLHDITVKGIVADSTVNGFPNRTDSTISFNDGSRRFTINPSGSSFDYYVAGTKHTVSSSDVLNVNYVDLTDTEGPWYIYYDGATLTATLSPNHAAVRNIIENTTWVAIVFWDADNNKGQLCEERHGLSMSPLTHVYLHETMGTRYDGGLALNNISADQNGSADSHAQFGGDAGQIFDEDIEHTLNAINSTTGLQIWYRDTSGWTFTTNAGFSMLTAGSGRLAYDNAGTLTEVTNGDFVLCHVFATNFSHLNPVVVIGQTEYSTKKSAQEGALTEITTILPIADISPELKPIASVIFQTKNTFVNSVKAIIVSTDEGDDYVDFRTDILSPAFSSAQEHGNLAGLDDEGDHTWATLINGTRAFTGDQSFDTFKAIAMACDNGSTFPTSPSPVLGQWFLHDTTGRTILYQYDGSNWAPFFLYGAAIVYVSGSGTDDQEHGTAVGTNAYATVQFAIDEAARHPGNAAAELLINIAAGTHSEDVILATPTINYPVHIKGTLTVIASGTSDTTPGTTFLKRTTIEDQNVFGSATVGDFVRITSGAASGDIRVIWSIDVGNDVATIAGHWSADVGSGITFDILRQGTIINTTSTFGFAIQPEMVGIEISNIKLTGTGSFTFFQFERAQSLFTNCSFVGNGAVIVFAVAEYSNAVILYSYLENNAAGRSIIRHNGTVQALGSLLRHITTAGGSNVSATVAARTLIQSRTVMTNVNSKAITGILSTAGSYLLVQGSATDYQQTVVDNCITGIRFEINSFSESVSLGSNIMYTNCTTDISGDGNNTYFDPT